MDKIRILVVDDDPRIAEVISLYLNKEGYETLEAYSGTAAMAAFASYAPDLVMLDLMLPEMDGYQVCGEIRKTGKTPIIMLTAKGETFDKVQGLELGADDYIVKPFEPKELIARVKAVLRRYDSGGDNDTGKICIPGMTINHSTYTVECHGEILELPPKEFELLSFFARHPNQVFTRDKLLDKIWGYEFMGDTRTVDVHIKRIREKTEKEGNEWGIKTVWGVGYKLEVRD